MLSTSVACMQGTVATMPRPSQASQPIRRTALPGMTHYSAADGWERPSAAASWLRMPS